MSSHFFQVSTRQSLFAFSEKAIVYSGNIINAFDALDRATKQIQTDKVVWADQCKSIEISLQHICETIHEFADFLDQTATIPLDALPRKYVFAAELSHLEKKIHSVLALLERICARSLQRLRPLHYAERTELFQHIEKLLHGAGEIPQQIMTWLGSLSLQEVNKTQEHQRTPEKSCHVIVTCKAEKAEIEAILIVVHTFSMFPLTETTPAHQIISRLQERLSHIDVSFLLEQIDVICTIAELLLVVRALASYQLHDAIGDLSYRRQGMTTKRVIESVERWIDRIVIDQG